MTKFFLIFILSFYSWSFAAATSEICSVGLDQSTLTPELKVLSGYMNNIKAKFKDYLKRLKPSVRCNPLVPNLFSIEDQCIVPNFTGLNQDQVDDLIICLKKRGLSFTQINLWKNQIDLGSDIDSTRPLFHNFSKSLYKEMDSKTSKTSLFENGIFISGNFVDVKGYHSFKNAIISNVTFVGNFSNLDFKGACLVNVNFDKAGIFEMMKIKTNASFAKNISNSRPK